MEINCEQMDVLLSFYLEGGLSNSLKNKVEKHLEICSSCRAKYNMLKNVINDLKESIDYREKKVYEPINSQYSEFQTNLSAYIDNELPANESIKIKKYTINNKQARKDLEDSYNIRRLMNESFRKTKLETKHDYSKKIIKKLNPNTEYNLNFHPIIKFASFFIMTSLAIASIVFFVLTL